MVIILKAIMISGRTLGQGATCEAKMSPEFFKATSTCALAESDYDYVGAGYRGESCGMRGGEIRIEGSAGDYLGEHLCGGKITVLGDAGDFPGIANRGGVIVIGGNAHLPGAEMASGAITVFGRARVLPSYQRQETVEIDGQSLKKFLGDLVDGGKGELYVASMEA